MPRPKIVKNRRSSANKPAKSEGRVKNYVVQELTQKAVGILLSSAADLDPSELYVLLQQEYRKLTEKLFDQVLLRLIDDSRVSYNAKSNTFRHPAAKVRTGVVMCFAQQYPFVVDDETGQKISIVEQQARQYLPGDKVNFVFGPMNETAVIQEVAERSISEIVGEVKCTVKKNGTKSYHFRKFDPRLSYLSVGFSQKDEVLDSWVGQKVVARISNYPTEDLPKVMVEIQNVLPVTSDAELEIELAVRQFGVPHEFSPETLAEAEALPSRVMAKDRTRRVDLRDVPFCTIDGEDARDFDDAVYAEKLNTGDIRLLVAIADVSHYVKPGQPLDKDAQLRSTSVYFPRRVIPMLPEKLSNGICSLNPGVERCCMVCDMVITPLGMVTAYQFYPALILSHARLTYTDVWAYLSGEEPEESKLPSDMKPHIDVLYSLYKVLREARERRGAIDFSTREPQVLTSESGEVIGIVARELNDANRLIEECMLAANTCAADFIARHDRLCLYRVHDAPSIERLRQLRQTLSGFGLTLKGGDKPTAADYEEVIEKIAGRPYAEEIQMHLLRSMQRAVYCPDNIGHYGLGYEAYTHFTSPIRRYPDLLVHRTIRSILSRRHYQPEVYEASCSILTSFSGKGLERTMQAMPRVIADSKFVQGKDDWSRLGKITSACERRADEASRDVVAWLKCRYMKATAKGNKTYQGRITAVTQFGIYVELDEIYVEGFVHISNLGYDYFVYSDEGTLIGQDFGETFKIGDRVKVKVMEIDEDRRRIDFRLVK